MASLHTKEQFQEALYNDDYAEYQLDTGDILVTDWEGDGYIFPSVIPEESEHNSDEAMALIKEELQDLFDFSVRTIEWDNNNEVYQIRVKT